MTTLIDARLGENVTVPHSYLTSCAVADGAMIARGSGAKLRAPAPIRAWPCGSRRRSRRRSGPISTPGWTGGTPPARAGRGRGRCCA